MQAALGNNKDVPATTPALSEFMCQCLSVAEPDSQPHSAAVVGWHPAAHDMLKCFYATDAAELRMGQNLRGKETTEVALTVWKVMTTSESVLSNPHGLARVAAENRSCCPLKTTAGVAFACLVSGPPCVPDELLETLANTAGPLLERVWKHDKIIEAINNVMQFIKQAAMDQHQLVYPSFEMDAQYDEKAKNPDAWQWQPLPYHPHSRNKFELELKWSLGVPIGVLTVTLGTFTQMSEQLVVLLHAMAQLLQEAIDEIEPLTPGDTPPLASVQEVLVEYGKLRPQMAEVLETECQSQLRLFEPRAIFTEIYGYEEKAIDEQQKCVVKAALILLGQTKRSSKSTWQSMTKLLKNTPKLHEEMLKLPMGKETPEHKKRWDEMTAEIKELNLDKIAERSPAPLKVVIVWLQTAKMIHHISFAIGYEAKELPPDPIADKLFDLIDLNGDGHITAAELVTYTLKEFPSRVAHTLLRVLDVDQSGFIDRQEWRKAWASGQLSALLIKEHENEKEKVEDGMRLRKKRDGGVLELTAAAAAEQFRSQHPELDLDYVPTKGGKKKLPPMEKKSK